MSLCQRNNNKTFWRPSRSARRRLERFRSRFRTTRARPPRRPSSSSRISLGSRMIFNCRLGLNLTYKKSDTSAIDTFQLIVNEVSVHRSVGGFRLHHARDTSARGEKSRFSSGRGEGAVKTNRRARLGEAGNAGLGWSWLPRDGSSGRGISLLTKCQG